MTTAPAQTFGNAALPPQNLEAEESVLGAMMLSPGAIATVVEIVDASDLPVNVDFESGFSDTPAGITANVRRCIDTGVAGQKVKLALSDGTGTDKATIEDGTSPVKTDGSEDYGPSLEVWDPTSGTSGAWVPYTANSFVTIPLGGTKLLVRTKINPDALDEGDHKFNLTATNTGATSDSGEAIIDDHGGGVQQKEVTDVVEERHAADDHGRLHPLRRTAVEETQQDQRRTERHQQEDQRRRILRDVQKRDQRATERVAVLPLRGITVQVQQAQRDEGQCQHQAGRKQERLAQRGHPGIDATEDVTKRHHRDPRHERIRDEHRMLRRVQQEALTMHERPEG